MNKFTKKNCFIGVDISKDVLDLSLLSNDSTTNFVHIQVGNNIKGFKKMRSFIKENGFKIIDCALCMEHTGTYGLLFFAWLSKEDILFCVEPGLQIKRSLGMVRGKNDKVDSERIAEYLYTNRAKLKAYDMPSSQLIKIKQLLTYRDQMVRIKTALKNSLKSHKLYRQVSNLESIEQALKEHIMQQEARIKGAEKEIVDALKSDSNLKRNYDLATSVKGIGLVTASVMITTTNNFKGFENGRKYACYASMAPFEFTSGSSIRGKSRTSKLGNKKIKTLLCNGANTAIMWDPELKKYYKRKIKEGKDHTLIINAVGCKLINRVFAVIKRQTPYVTTYNQNFA